MSLFTDLKEVFTAYAQRIKGLAEADEEIKAELGDVAESIFSSDKSKAISSVLTNEWAKYSMDGVVEQNKLYAHTHNNYNVYWLIFSQACSVWFEETPSVSYVAVNRINGADAPVLLSDNAWRVSGTTGAVRYRKSDGNLPTPTNKLQIAAGTFLAVTIPTSVSASEFYMSFDFGAGEVDTELLNNAIRLNTTQINQVRNLNYVEYINGSGVDGSTKRLNIYIAQPSNRYVLYEFVNTVVDNKNANVWRIAYARLTDSNFNVIKDITVTGEWECAIKLDGRSDFAGGFLHGDEIATQTACFIDGKKTGLSSIVGKMPFKNLTFVQRSNLYDPNDSTTIFAVHGSAHEFTDKLTIRQSLTFSGAYTMGLSYLAMFPIAKTVSPKAFTDIDFNYAAVSLPVSIRGASKVTLTDDSITAEFELKNHSEVDSGTGDLTIQDNGGGAYNKCYFISCHSGATVASGDTWKAATEYRIMG